MRALRRRPAGVRGLLLQVSASQKQKPRAQSRFGAMQNSSIGVDVLLLVAAAAATNQPAERCYPAQVSAYRERSGRSARRPEVKPTAGIVAAVQGLLIDGPGAGQVVDVGEPPVRRAVFVPAVGGFGERAYRYYLESVDIDQATYRCAGQVEWPPEASSEVVRRLSDQRQPSADATAPGARLN
jgi:hypothetical protein